MLALVSRTMARKGPGARTYSSLEMMRKQLQNGGRKEMKPEKTRKVEEMELLAPEPGKIMVQGLLPSAIVIENKVVENSFILLPTKLLKWKIKSADDINAHTLSIINIIHPMPDILIVGTGNECPYQSGLMQRLQELPIAVEVLKTEHACGTFNLLNQEGRRVIGAFFQEPPLH